MYVNGQSSIKEKKQPSAALFHSASGEIEDCSHDVYRYAVTKGAIT